MVVPNSGKRDEVLKCIKRKEEVENKISELGEILKANNVGMREPLIDESGFPRNDIDVYQVRFARHEIICLQNDLKSIMKEIENGLEVVHTEAKFSSTSSRKLAEPTSVEPMEICISTGVDKKPFVKINLVSASSPAALAGIQVNDEILEFGTINSSNFKDLTQIAELVKHRESNEIKLKIRRITRIMDLCLIPKKWAGRGLLGCNIILIESTPIDR